MESLTWAWGLVNNPELGATLAHFAQGPWGLAAGCLALLLSWAVGVASGTPMPTLEGVMTVSVWHFAVPATPQPALKVLLFALALTWYAWLCLRPNHTPGALLLDAWDRAQRRQ